MAAMCAMKSLNKFDWKQISSFHSFMYNERIIIKNIFWNGNKDSLHYLCQVLFGYDLVRISKSGIAGGNCDLWAFFSKNIWNCPLSVSEKKIQLIMSTAIK